MSCPNCDGSGWVCEWHPDQAWPEACDCGAGMFCEVCRPAADVKSRERAKAVQRAVEAARSPLPYSRR